MSSDLGPWTTPVYFQNFILADPAKDTLYQQSGLTFTASANGDSLAGTGISVSFGSCGSKRRGWAWSPDGMYFAYVSSPNGPDWNLKIVALQDIRQSDCSIVQKGRIAASASGIFAGPTLLQCWTNANFGWAGSKAVLASGAYSGGSGFLRCLVCPVAPNNGSWSELVSDSSGQNDWINLVSPSGLAVAFVPKKLNIAAQQLEFRLVSTAIAQQVQFSKNNIAQSITSTGNNPSITTNQHTVNGVHIDKGDGSTIDVDDPDGTLRIGLCKVSPVVFPSPVILDGPEDKTRQQISTIRNAAAIGCLQITAIGNADPFTIGSHPPFPFFIAPGKNLPLTISFSPLTLGDYDKPLPVTLAPADPTSDTEISCKGSARMSLANCAITGPSKNPEVIFGVNNTALCTYAIKNSGSDKLKVNSIGDNAPFSVVAPLPDYSRLLSNSNQIVVTVEYKPDGVGTVTKDLQVNCTPQNGDSLLHCTGTARMPAMGLAADPPVSFTTYRYHRKRVSVNLKNTGEVALTIDVTGTPSGSFQCSPVPTIAPNCQQAFDVIVWSGALGPFSISLTILGTFQVQVGNTIISDKTSCTVSINGMVSPMPPDRLEPNDDFLKATPVDLPMPNLWTMVGKGYVGLSLDDHNSAGNDEDWFAVSFQSSTQDDNSTSDSPTTNRLGMGILMNYYPPSLSIRSNAKPEIQEDGRLFTRKLKIFKSDAYNRSLFNSTDGEVFIPCPSRKFPDKKLYAVMCNPDFISQGPVEYDIRFEYEPARFVCSGGFFESIEFVKLHRYYEKIWLIDPPRDIAGKVVNEKAWLRGASVVIENVESFIDRHLVFISQPEVLRTLQKSLNQRPGAILACERFTLAQIARNAGLFRKAEQLYRQSVLGFSRTEIIERQADALQGLNVLYRENHMFAEAKGVEKVLEKLLNKSRSS